MSKLSGSYPWAVLLFTFKDTSKSEVRKSKIHYQSLFSGGNEWNISDYWRGMSGGEIDISGSRIFGWEEIDLTVKEFDNASRSGALQRAVNFFEEEKGEDLSQFFGVIGVTDSNPDHAASTWVRVDNGSGGKTVHGIIANEGWTVAPEFFAHEMGHGFGLGHAYDDSSRKAESWSSPGEYFDHWDIMGGMGNHSFQPSNFGSSGPGMSAPMLAEAGWISSDEVWSKPGSGQIRLVPLSKLEGGGNREYRAAKLEYFNPSRSRKETYWIEHRTPGKWDQGVPEEAVLIRRVEGETPHLVNRNSDKYDPKWKEGNTYVDGRHGISVEVVSIENDGAVVEVERTDDLWDKVVTKEKSSTGPDLSRVKDRIILSWKGKGNKYLNTIESGTSYIDSGDIVLYNKKVLSKKSDSSPNTCEYGGSLVMAWRGENGRLKLSLRRNGAWATPVETQFASNLPPSIAKFDGDLWMAWCSVETGEINVARASQADDWEKVSTLEETSSHAPSLSRYSDRLYIAWKGLGNKKINVIQSVDGKKFEKKKTINEETEASPCIEEHREEIYLAWTGTDKRLNLLQSHNGVQWAEKTTLQERSMASPSLLSIGKKIIWAWTGTDVNNSLNTLVYQE